MSRRIAAKAHSERTLAFDHAPTLGETNLGRDRELRFWRTTAFVLAYALLALAIVLALAR